MEPKNIFFWQAKKNFLSIFSQIAHGYLLIFLNYAIWLLLFFVSYLLVKNNPNAFWQLLTATLIAEIIERVSKKYISLPRPMFKKNQDIPKGLVSNWYNTGSFPSGHTSKTVFFLLFLIQYHVSNISFFLLISLPLIFFRVLVGFHYPLDILGGILIGFAVWALTKNIILPDSVNLLAKTVFDAVFFIK